MGQREDEADDHWTEFGSDGDRDPADFDEPAAKPSALKEAVERVSVLEAEVTRLRDVLFGIAESDHYRRYPKQHEDGGCRGQSGLRAVRALTGKHGSHLNDDDVRSNDNNRRVALGLPEAAA